MAGFLSVDGDGLRTAASSSDAIADALGSGMPGAVTGSQATHVAVAALDAALQGARTGLSQRVGGQAWALRSNGHALEGTDRSSAQDIAGAM
ncbi:hypothetical protein HNP40_002171 [Mycobacteroides chelonae]|nr:hypothetical protein [Mycobacteroides chelonae]